MTLFKRWLAQVGSEKIEEINNPDNTLSDLGIWYLHFLLGIVIVYAPLYAHRFLRSGDYTKIYKKIKQMKVLQIHVANLKALLIDQRYDDALFYLQHVKDIFKICSDEQKKGKAKVFMIGTRPRISSPAK